jgi:pyruvate/2-oxoglutarate dehydrogenase complex dihydrolipoamide dehydrogenase (E3) component
MTKVGRAVEKGKTQGFMKIMVDAVMYARAPYTVIQRAMHIHPTVSELIATMLGELQPLSDGAGAPQSRTEK